MTETPPIYRFGKDMPGTSSPPDFALWLADRQAKMHALADRTALRDWLAGAWAEDRIAPLMAAIDARSAVPDHAFIAMKPDPTASSEPAAADALWHLGQTQTMTDAHSVTVIVFQTTHRFLLGDDDR